MTHQLIMISSTNSNWWNKAGHINDLLFSFKNLFNIPSSSAQAEKDFVFSNFFPKDSMITNNLCNKMLLLTHNFKAFLDSFNLGFLISYIYCHSFNWLSCSSQTIDIYTVTAINSEIIPLALYVINHLWFSYLTKYCLK